MCTLHGRRAWYMHRLFAGLELARVPPALALRQLRALRSAWPVLERGRRVGGQAGGRPQERMVRHTLYNIPHVEQWCAMSVHCLPMPYTAALLGV